MKRLQHALPAAILCAALAALFARLFLGEVIFWGTPLLQFYPWRAMAFDALRVGRLPLWNPLAGNGAPLLANYQTAVFYPPNWLYLVIPTEHAMGWVGVLHLLWAGLGTMAYLRWLGVDRLGQGVGALAFALSGYVVGRFGFLTITSAVAWLPWLMWAVEGVAAAGGAARLTRRAALLAGIVAMLLLAGHAQTAFYSLLLAGVYAVWLACLYLIPGEAHPNANRSQNRGSLASIRAIPRLNIAAIALIPALGRGKDQVASGQRPDGPPPSKGEDSGEGSRSPQGGDEGKGTARYALTGVRLGVALGAVVLGVALASVQLVPTAELMQTSQRAVGVEYEAALSYSFWPWHLLTFALPGLFGSPASGDYWGYGAYWEDAVYVGLLALVLAGRAVVRWRRAGRAGEASAAVRAVPFYGLSLLPVGVLALGWNTPVFPWLFEHVPTFDLFNAPARWMLLAVFALSVLAGVGADGWQARAGTPWAKRGIAAGLAVLLAAGATQALPGSAVEGTFVRAFARLGGLVVLSGGLGVLLRRAERSARGRVAWEAAALVLLAADLVTAHLGLNPTIDPATYHQRAALADAVPAGTRVLMLPDDEYTAKFDVFLDLTDFQAADRAHWDGLRASLLPNLGLIDGVAAASNFDPLLVGHHAALLETLDRLPPGEQAAAMARLNVGMLLSPTPRDDLELLGRGGPVYAYGVPGAWPRAALAACAPGGDGLRCERIEDGTAAVVLDEAERVRVAVTAEQAEWLVLVDTDYPGWQATVDGQPAAIERANGAFRAVEVPAGEHTVEFAYRPASLRIGAAISGVAAVVWCGMIIVGLRQPSELDAKGM